MDINFRVRRCHVVCAILIAFDSGGCLWCLSTLLEQLLTKVLGKHESHISLNAETSRIQSANYVLSSSSASTRIRQVQQINLEEVVSFPPQRGRFFEFVTFIALNLTMAFTMVRGHSIEDSIFLSFSNFIGLFKSALRFAKLRLAPYFSAVSPFHLQPPPCQWEWQGHSRLCGYSLPFFTPSRKSLVGPLPVAVERPNANGFLWKLSFGPWWLFNLW